MKLFKKTVNEMPDCKENIMAFTKIAPLNHSGITSIKVLVNEAVFKEVTNYWLFSTTKFIRAIDISLLFKQPGGDTFSYEHSFRSTSLDKEINDAIHFGLFLVSKKLIEVQHSQPAVK